MVDNNHMENMLHIHYSPTAKYSVGYVGINMRGDESQFHGVQLNNLLWRENGDGSQANLYLQSALGIAENDGDVTPGGFTGIAADWETRRYFASYSNRLTYADDIEESYGQNARVGIAPYVGDFGDLHTWLMLQVDHHPNEEDNFVVTPLVRMFKGPYLGEVGMSNNGDALLNLSIRF